MYSINYITLVTAHSKGAVERWPQKPYTICVTPTIPATTHVTNRPYSGFDCSIRGKWA